MTIYLGDFKAGSTIYIPFHTFNSLTGASVTISGFSATDIVVYKNGSATQRASDNGYTLLDTDGTDFDGLTGIHGFSIDTSDNSDSGFYASGADYWVVVSSITVDGQTVRFVAAIFSIENRSALRPTVAGRTLDVSSGGEAGIDWANIGTPTTAVNLSATNIDTDQVVASVSGNVAGNVTGSVGSLATQAKADVNAEVDTAISDAALATASNLATVANYIDTEVAAIKTKTDQLIFTASGQVDANALGMADGLITAAKVGTGAIDADALAADAVAEIQSGLASAANVAAVEADTQDIQSRLPAALNNGCMPADIQRINDVEIVGDGSGTPFNV